MTSLLGALLALAGVPLFVIISLLALLHYYWAEVDTTAFFISMYQIAQIPTLSAIPLFAFTGFLLAESQAANRLVRLSQTLLGWLPGGLAIMAVFICALFTALTGASGMTIVALGGMLYPALLKNGYPDGFSLGLLTTAGSLGLLFPPSLPLIIFGIVSQTPVDQLFIAGIVPGLLLVGALALFSFVKGWRTNFKATATSMEQVAASLRESVWELLLPVVILGGIYSGLIAVGEAAALSVLYILLVEVVIHREIRLGQLPGIIRDCMILVGGIIIILGAAMGYTNYLIDAQIPNQLLDFIQQHIDSRLVFLLALNLFLLAVGCMVDMYSALLVVVPLILPIAHAYEVHPVHLGIIFLTNLEIGYSTPPVGLNLFIASLRFDKPVLKLYWASLPFLAILLVALGLITYFPWLSLFLLK